MRLPWGQSVPREAYDAVVSERDHLRAQVATLTESLTRLSRHEAGLPELERQARKIDVSPMPAALLEHFGSFFDGKLGKMMRAQAYREHGRGRSWDDIAKDVLEPEPFPTEVVLPSAEQ